MLGEDPIPRNRAPLGRSDWQDSRDKQLQRSQRVLALPFPYHQPVAARDHQILDRPIEELAQDVHKQILSPVDILRCYGKIALLAQAKTNCLTEIMLPEAEKWAAGEGVNLKGPLAGIPVSLKDSIAVGGFDVSVGYSINTGQPVKEDGTIVKILKAAGTPTKMFRVCHSTHLLPRQAPSPT